MFHKNAVRNLVLLGGVTIFLFYFPMFFLNKDAIINATLEDHFYENFSAIVYFLASFLFLAVFITVKNEAKKRNFFFLVFALAFFFAGGEEISWGQRIFHFTTPSAIEAANAQGEFNIHNLGIIQHEKGFSGTVKSLINFNRMFILFYIVYTILIPVANRYSGSLSRFFARIRLPIIPIWFGFLFVLNEAICRITLTAISLRLNFAPEVAEIKEGLWALILFLMGIYFLNADLRQLEFKKQQNAETSPLYNSSVLQNVDPQPR